MAENRSWNLESFLDSLIVELDKAQDTLALKGVNRPLTYTVKDVGLDLQIFPQYTNDGILFSTARPGETGSSKVSIQLGSISDRQIRETTKAPVGKDDITVDMIEGIDDDTKKSLKKIGVKAASDIERMEEKNIDLGKADGTRRFNYSSLANGIAQARRKQSKPQISKLSLSQNDDGTVLAMSGSNLVLDASGEHFPIAMLNDKETKVLSAASGQLLLAVDKENLRPGANELTVALDPYSIIRLEVHA